MRLLGWLGWIVAAAALAAAVWFYLESRKFAALEENAGQLERSFARALNAQDAMTRDFAALTTPADQAEARAAFEAKLEKLRADLEPGAKIARDFVLSLEPAEFTLDPSKVSDEANAAYLAKIDADAAYTKTASGLRYRLVKPAPPGGAQPTAENEVQVHYKGTFIEGTEFDSSYARGEPATFPLKGVIPGWTEGVALMKEGETYELVIPYQLAYGIAGRGPIPPRQTLVFQVELLKVLPPPPPS